MLILSTSMLEQLLLKLEQIILLRNFSSITEIQGKYEKGHFLHLMLM